MNVLFICSLNKIRSLTAEQLFQNYPGLSVCSAGTQSNARLVVNRSMIDWAEVIIVMENEHREKIENVFKTSLRNKKIHCLDIGNEYEYMDENLIEILKREVPARLGILPL